MGNIQCCTAEKDGEHNLNLQKNPSIQNQEYTNLQIHTIVKMQSIMRGYLGRKKVKMIREGKSSPSKSMSYYNTMGYQGGRPKYDNPEV